MQGYAHVLLRQSGQYVLQHRENKAGISEPNTYSSWGGRLENGETFKAGAARELREETSVIVDEASLQELVTYDTELPGDIERKPSKRTVVFLADVDPSTSVHCNEGQGIVRAATLEELPDEKLAEVLHIAKRALGKRLV